MAKMKIKYRRYPQYVRRCNLSVQNLDSVTGTREAASDTSTGVAGYQKWITDVHSSEKAKLDYNQHIKPRELQFLSDLLREDFSDSESNFSTESFLFLVRRYKEAMKVWILDLYNLRNGDEELLIQLFRLLRCFPYEFLAPASLCLAGLALHHNSDFVKSEALSLLDHWGNKDVLSILQNHEPPTTPWLRMKYAVVKDSLERYVALQEN